MSAKAFAEQTLSSPQLKPVHATYAIRVAGVTVGELIREYELSENGTYVFKSTSRATGIAALFATNITEEMASGNFRLGDFKPDNYSYRRTKGKKTKIEQLEFDYTRGVTTKRRKGKEEIVELLDQSFDPLSYQLQLMLDLQNQTQTLLYPIQSPKKDKVYAAKTGAIETVETPFGYFETIKVSEQNPANKATTFWCAKSLHYLPVKVLIEDDGDNTVIVLKAFSSP